MENVEEGSIVSSDKPELLRDIPTKKLDGFGPEVLSENSISTSLFNNLCSGKGLGCSLFDRKSPSVFDHKSQMKVRN